MSDHHSPVADDLVTNNRAFAANFTEANLDTSPKLKLAIIACMDSRVDVFKVMGLSNGDAHIIRNAGGVVTDDVIRSLCLSQRNLGTREIVLVHHTKCGLHGIDEAGFVADLTRDAGMEPPWAIEGFDDITRSVRESIRRIRQSPFIPFTDHIRGLIYDVDVGLLRDVDRLQSTKQL